jgi:hypothetical protein
MKLPDGIDLNLLLMALGGLFGLGAVTFLLLLGWVLFSFRRLSIPPDADFMTALRATPLTVVLMLDLLDMLLDIFAAPFAWVILGYLGLQALRTVTVVEALIPGTQLIPTMTLAWIAARMSSMLTP